MVKEEIQAELDKNGKERTALHQQQAVYIEVLRLFAGRKGTRGENVGIRRLKVFCKNQIEKCSRKINDLNYRDHMLADKLREELSCRNGGRRERDA